MAYPKYLYRKVKTFYEDRKLQKRQELVDKTQEIYRQIPRIEEIDQEIQKQGIMLSRAVLDKKDTQETFARMRENTLKLNMEKCELLVANGYPSDYLMPKYECGICKDEGFVKGRMCSCFSNMLRKEAYLASNLPLVMDKQSFDTFDLSLYPDTGEGMTPKEIMSMVLQVCRDYARDFGKNNENLLMYGGTGLGKTFLSSCIAKSVLEQGYSVFYQPSYKIFGIFEDNKFGNENKELLRAQMNDIYKTDLLIIDDLGTELVTAYTAEVLFDLLNTRLNSKKKTIINTNLNMSDMEKIYSPRITSRMIGNYTRLKFCGEDIRRMEE